MANDRIVRVARAFEDLLAVAHSEPGLSPFRDDIAVLVSLAHRAVLGEKLEWNAIQRNLATIPTLTLAKLVLSIIERIPGPLENEDASVLDAMECLHANLSRAIVSALFAGYPELMADAGQG